MTEAQAAAIAQPDRGAVALATGLQGPDTNVKIGPSPSPRHYKFDPEDNPPQRNVPYIPAKYRNRNFDTGSNRTLQQKAESDGLETIEVILPEDKAGRTDWGIKGLRGKDLKPGDREEMPVGHALALVQSGVAVLVISSETAKDERLIAELEAKGYAFATTNKPAREREEFRDVFKRKKTSWMAKLSEP
jgi:hypothetical protein